MRTETYKFSKNDNAQFFATLKNRVNFYFENNHLSKYGNYKIILKAVCMLCIYLVPFGLINSGYIENALIILGLWFVMGFGMAGIGLSIMHDGNHGAFSKYKILNRIAGYTANIVGGDAKLWKLQHNVLHHTYTNIHQVDEDIDGPSFLRFSPHHTKKKIHRYQHILAFFAYGLMTLSWAGWKDITQAIRFKEKGLIKKNKFTQELTSVIFWKLLYFFYLIFIPIFLFNVPVWLVLLGFFIMHFVCGLILSLIFQLAHVMPQNEFPLPNEEGVIENNWAVHQLQTTANFSPKSKFFSWYIGGLNYQIEHHLFANICHTHYKKLSVIVKSTAQEFNLPYHSEGNFFRAIKSHYIVLKNLGR